MLKTLAAVVALALLPSLADAQAILLQNTAKRTITTAAGSPLGTPATLTLEVGTLGAYEGSATALSTVRSVRWCVAFDGIGQGWTAVLENAPAVYTTFAAVKSPDPVSGFPDMATDPSFYCANGK